MNEMELSSLAGSIGHLLPFPALFLTISGAHLYGFPSPDSDVDLRGAYVLPLEAVIGLDRPDETVTRSFEQAGREIDLVVHDIRKFIALLLGKNGYVLEQLYAPLVVQGGPALEELRDLGQGCITRHLYHHYEGFARNQVERFESESPRRVKTLLYIYRVLLTGIYLLENGQVESYLPRLKETFRLPFIDELIALKQAERAVLPETGVEGHRASIARLRERLEEAFRGSSLPEQPTNRPALNDFLVQVRLEMGRG